MTAAARAATAGTALRLLLLLLCAQSAAAVRESGVRRVRWPLRSRGGRRASAAGLHAGFANGGNTCYLASALQVLLHTPSLWEFATNAANIADLKNEQHLRIIQTLQEVQRIYEEASSSGVDGETTNAIRQNFSDAGFLQDIAMSQDDSASLILKILEPFDSSKVPGFAMESHTLVLEVCDPARNGMIRAAPGLDLGELSPWRRMPGAGCSLRREDPPSLVTLRPGGSESERGASPRDLLKSTKIEGNLELEVLEDLYVNASRWHPCNFFGDRTGESLNSRSPRATRYCNGDVAVDVNFRTGVYGGRAFVVYRWEERDRWEIPDSDLAMLTVQRMSFVYSQKAARSKRRRVSNALDLGSDGFVDLPVIAKAVGQEVVRRFRLSACTSYIGTSKFGHWIAIARMHGGPSDGAWYRFDDAKVSLLSDAAAVRECSENAPFLVFEKTRKRRWVHELQ